MLLPCCLRVQLVRFIRVLSDTDAFIECPGKLRLRFWMPLRCGLAVPGRRLSGIGWDPEAPLVHKGKIALCSWVALLCGFLLPQERLGIVDRHAASIKVDTAHFILCGRVALFRRFCEQPYGLLAVRLHMPSQVIAGSQGGLRNRVFSDSFLL